MFRKNIRTVSKYVLTSVISIGLCLGLLEGVMRLMGLIYTQNQSFLNPTLNEEKNQIRVVTLGESTTASGFSEGFAFSWPLHLEEILNQAGLGYHFQVINLARGGVNSAFLVNEALEKINDLKPHIVITMMGINDVSGLEYLHRSDWRSLRIVKLYHWLTSEPPMKNKDVIEADINATLSAFVKKTPLNAIEHSAPLVIQEMKNKYPSLEWYIRWVIANCVFDKLNALTAPSQRQMQGPLLKWVHDQATLAHSLNSKSSEALYFLVQMSLQTSNFKNIEDQALNSFSVGAEVTAPTINALTMLPPQHQMRIKSHYRKLGVSIDFDNTQFYNKTRSNYRHLADELKKQKIIYFAMQYPTVKITSLKEVFSSASVPISGSYCSRMQHSPDTVKMDPAYSDVFFISNENFNEPKVRDNPSKYFIDRFAENCGGPFGHATILGNKRIAENALAEIKKNWPVVEKRLATQ